ncbi:vitamin K epoxide reductase family protein [Anaeromyxobacter sp. PSR-1]|uniref:vitamin K epoxide reductase family protein n=1 Tax=Anaeromyxobacter sp. PSR-1 TaxID=1300915 RepID=UPI0005E184C1|nr:vitamin K epoxide reductase family protein [Anaeromyxobacter sp. PSR-1]GAO01456.1 vitamin K epoxide reductase family protein [Anaeromyxobacter sp. PSR-1]
MEIRVVGAGCARCRRALEEAEKAIALAGVTASASRTSDVAELIPFRIASTPAVFVDGVLRSAGRVPTAREIASWLRPAAPVDPAPSPTRSLTGLVAACAAGLVLSVLLAVLHVRANTGAAGSFCAVNAEIDCDAVALSPHSILLGAPIAAWGVLVYVAMGLLAGSGLRRARPHPRWPAGLLAVAAGAGVVASGWLAWLSEVRIGAFCIVCAGCWAANVAIAGLAWRATSSGGGFGPCLAADLAAMRRRPAHAATALLGVAGVAAALALLYPPYWKGPW